MNDNIATISDIKNMVMAFVDERNWRQFHTPKNVCMALSGEAAELAEYFLWTHDNNPQEPFEKHRQEITHEVADVFAYLVSFCAENNIDLAQAVHEKIKLNKVKYPIEKARNNKAKYTDL